MDEELLRMRVLPVLLPTHRRLCGLSSQRDAGKPGGIHDADAAVQLGGRGRGRLPGV